MVVMLLVPVQSREEQRFFACGAIAVGAADQRGTITPLLVMLLLLVQNREGQCIFASSPAAVGAAEQGGRIPPFGGDVADAGAGQGETMPP